MTTDLLERMRESVAGTALEASFDIYSEPLRSLHLSSKASEYVEPRVLLGLARVIASQAGAARYLCARPSLLDRILRSPEDALEAREDELEILEHATHEDLEHSLDELRFLRRDETLFAACFDLGNIHRFERISEFLSSLAQACLRWAFRWCHSADAPELAWVVIGMGKVAGRELTYHSDLDLLFLYPEASREPIEVARLAQRLIGHLSTVTGAGSAYAVDARLRPSGRQGALVSSFDSYERYQLEKAQTWEHVALARTRVLAGCENLGREFLSRVRHRVFDEHRPRWAAIDRMRERIESERAAGRKGAFKTGRGGLMDVDFLASGALLECGALDIVPSPPKLLRELAPGPATERLLEDYRLLRRVEARARFVMGRGLEAYDFGRPDAAIVAELIESGSDPSEIAHQVEAARARTRDAYVHVVEAGTIAALNGAPIHAHGSRVTTSRRSRQNPPPHRHRPR